MPTTRVVPTFASKGLYPLAVALGIIHGVAILHLAEYLSNKMILRSWQLGMVIGLTLAAAITPWILTTLVIARQTHRKKPVFIAVPLMAAAMIATSMIYGVLREPTAGLGGDEPVWTFLIPFAISTAAALGIAALARWLALHRVWPLEQSGLLCWHCGYDLGTPAITLCPECAEPANPSLFRAAWLFSCWRRIRRSGVLLLVLVLLTALPWVAHRIITVRLPGARFLSRLAAPGHPPQQWLYIRGGQWGTGVWNGLLAVHPLPDTAEQAIGYAYWPHQPELADHPVRMRVFLCQPMGSTSVTATTLGGGSTSITVPTMPSEGSIRVYADLSPAQAEQVMQAGRAPDSLIQMLRTKAVENNWQPLPSTNWGPNYSAQEVPIDPEQHFQTLPSAVPKQQPADPPGR